jgi:hypothetical protein
MHLVILLPAQLNKLREADIMARGAILLPFLGRRARNKGALF